MKAVQRTPAASTARIVPAMSSLADSGRFGRSGMRLSKSCSFTASGQLQDELLLVDKLK